jgi:hypothetical protein
MGGKLPSPLVAAGRACGVIRKWRAMQTGGSATSTKAVNAKAALAEKEGEIAPKHALLPTTPFESPRPP